MATIAYAYQNIDGKSAVGRLALWDGLVTGSLVADPVPTAGEGDICVQVTGTPDGSTVTLRGSNKASPAVATAADWFTLTQPDGTDAAFTAAGGCQIVERPLWIAPIMSTPGASSDMDVHLYLSR